MSPQTSGPARRLHLFEFEDLSWFPSLFRNAITDWLATFVGVYEPAVPLLMKLLDQEGSDHVVDLCSGGAGPWDYLKTRLDTESQAQGGAPISLTLTDRYPNRPAFVAVSEQIGPNVDFEEGSVDARHVPEHLKGVRTLFTSFHHLKPADAKAVLADAAQAGRSIGVFEFVQRDWRIIRDCFWQVPLSMMRSYRTWAPRRRWQTVLVPLILLTSVWDAVVSQLRAYRADELAAMIEELPMPGYRWETGVTFPPGASDPITYVIGYPASTDA